MLRLARLTAAITIAGIVALSAASTPRIGAAAPAASLVKTAPAHILVDAKGMTLYLFSPDKPNKSVCTGACAKYWPPLLVPAGAGAPTTMPGIGGTFGVAARADGSSQLTYDGAPLYTWVKDKKPGDMTGQGVEGIWWTVVIAGKASGSAGAAPATALVKSAPARMLVNAQGMTLYLFSPDKPNKSVCIGKCAAAWPPLLVPAGTTAATTLPGLGGTFGASVRADRSSQLTYDKAPLYTWFKDKKPGDVTGQGVEGVWWAVTA